jgi:hypothetical protein
VDKQRQTRRTYRSSNFRTRSPSCWRRSSLVRRRYRCSTSMPCQGTHWSHGTIRRARRKSRPRNCRSHNRRCSCTAGPGLRNNRSSRERPCTARPTCRRRRGDRSCQARTKWSHRNGTSHSRSRCNRASPGRRRRHASTWSRTGRWSCTPRLRRRKYGRNNWSRCSRSGSRTHRRSAPASFEP